MDQILGLEEEAERKGKAARRCTRGAVSECDRRRWADTQKGGGVTRCGVWCGALVLSARAAGWRGEGREREAIGCVVYDGDEDECYAPISPVHHQNQPPHPSACTRLRLCSNYRRSSVIWVGAPHRNRVICKRRPRTKKSQPAMYVAR